MQITLDTLPDVLFDLHPGDRIFLMGKLGAGKTTFAQALIKRFLGDPKAPVPSPTYTYYHKYPKNLYHFDLYRIERPEDIIRIGAEEIFDNPGSICIIEWPEVLVETVIPTKVVRFTETEKWRDISITDCQAGDIDKQG